MSEELIYLDYLSTTPVLPQVAQAMLPYFTEHFGNPSSLSHPFGWRAQAACDVARERVARLIGAVPQEIVFTSGATEANNLALRGATPAGRHLITQSTEHRAVLDVAKNMQASGWSVTVVPVDAQGRVSVDAIAAAIRPETALVSVMHTNNEIGTTQPIADLGALCHARNVLLHCDAAQAATWAEIDVTGLQVDLLSLSAHKMYGPKGVGALYVRRRGPRVSLQPLTLGGGQERGRRSGTLNVPGIVGMGEAAAWCAQHRDSHARSLATLRDALAARIDASVDGVWHNGHPTLRHPGNLNLSFRGTDSASLMRALRDVALSAGSACQSGDKEPSFVLGACGMSAERARSCLRFGLGLGTTQAHVQKVAARIKLAVDTARRVAAQQASPSARGFRI